MKTKSILVLASLISLAALPASLLAASTGLPFPASIDALDLLGTFVVSGFLLTAFADYGRGARFAGSTAAVAAPAAKAAHPLAA
jgi:hypothetical protein